MDARLERVYERWCARRVLPLWDAPEVVREWLDRGEEALRKEAQSAGMSAGMAAAVAAAGGTVGGAASAAAASWAAEATEQATCRAAGSGAPDYYSRAAVGAAALARYDGAQRWSTVGNSVRERAKREELSAQQHARDLIATLSTLLPERGLEALRTPEAEEDPWLTREVWCIVMERDVEVQVPVLHEDGTTTCRTVVVRTIVDWEAAKAWCDWMIAAKKADAAPVPEEAPVGAGEGGGDVAPSL